MYQNATSHQPGTIDRVEYKKFAAAVANVFSKDWTKAEAQFEACLKFLPAIPNEAWRPMATAAAETWESWPRNLVRATKELFYRWKADAKVVRQVSECEYCNSVGFFSGGQRIQVKPGIFVWYWHTWRCGACANWRGVVGRMIPMAMPLEVQTHGYVVKKLAKMQSEGERIDISAMAEVVGQQVNEKTNRPPWINYREPGEDG